MNRRAFLKLFIGTVAVATIPIPKFLAPKLYIDDGTAFEGYGSVSSVNLGSGILTQEMIEEAALKSVQNMGRPDKILMSEDSFIALNKYFGYKIVYE
jgi:hypothetical protein